ncbi:MAG: hypothetical protein RIC87_21925 [Kiloniellales bacterium]
MQRVMIIGGPGSGKSTLARQIGEALDLPVYHIDRLFWRPGWQESEKGPFNEKLRRLYLDERWIVEGNYSRTWPERVARADCIIFLDLPTPLRLWRLLKRMLASYGQVRADMAPGCPERLDWAFLHYAATFPTHSRPRALELLAQLPAEKERHHLRSRTAVRAILQRIRPAAAVQA